MKLVKLGLLNIFLFTLVTGYTQELAQLSTPEHEKKLVITHVAGDNYVFTSYNTFKGKKYSAHGMYVVTRDGVVLINTTWDETQMQPLLDSIMERHQKKVVLAIATHFHEDCVAGIKFLRDRGIKTISSKQTYDLCKVHDTANQPEFYFTKDTTFTIGGHKIQTYYPGAGHAKDNQVVWLKDQNILYAGCLARSIATSSLGNIADGDVKEWPSSIRRVMKKFPKHRYVITGHDDWKSNDSLEHTLKLVER